MSIRLSDRPALTDDQRDEFRSRGLTKVPGLLPEDIVQPVHDLIHGVLDDAGVSQDGSWTAQRLNGTNGHAIQSKLLKQLKNSTKRSEVFAAICSPEVHYAAEKLMDRRRLIAQVSRPQVLFTAPNAERWELPHKVWHMDIPRLGEIGCPGVQMFTFIDRVDPGGAGTVVAAGSHHYVNDQGRVKSKHVKKQLRQTLPWFNGLFRPGGGDRRRHYLDTVTKDKNVELQVVELTGEPGDVWLMDLRLLHSLAPNATDRPRLMATQRYFLTELGKAVYEDT